jgi:hypothetical protein
MGTVLPEADWQPILIGGLFKLNGRTSWIFSEGRESRMAEIEQRPVRTGGLNSSIAARRALSRACKQVFNGLGGTVIEPSGPEAWP